MQIGKGLSRVERETTIRWSEADDEVTIFTESPVFHRKLTKVLESYPEVRVTNWGLGVRVQLPLKCVSLRKKSKPRPGTGFAKQKGKA